MRESFLDTGVMQAIKTRRDDVLKITQQEAAVLAGVSLASWNKIETGRQDPATLSIRNKRGMCAALGWSPDSIDRILRGEEPELLDQPKEHTATTVGAPSGGLPTDSEGLKRLIREAVAEALADRLP
jgi:DNA-binding XRE family transcriptional regulator